ncbi:PREDICTED: uncharacterized protein LOC107064546 isoform X2 [Polistes dominula]|uniref:Tetratricopeptide repeat protein 29 n=1 Tax=Polistes dominula TaxID=743375 RepID=A0ABM1HXX5_POLDO|nr:PREDICTED: uncharacterized protein LOC107064546 isoform X2 [Polistes dominula]
MTYHNWNFCKDLFDNKNHELVLKKNQIEEDSLFNRRKKIQNLAQAEWYNMKKIRENLKAMLPMIPLSEVKRFYLKHDEAVIDELKEKGLENAADFIRNLIEFDEERRNIAGPGTSTWTKPRLKDQRDLLNQLKETLIEIGKAEKLRQSIEASNLWIKISIFFQSKGEDWWWVTKKLYENALKTAELIDEDDARNITVVRYLYGKFLSMIEIDWLKALEYLDIAREASENKIWNVSKIINEKEKSIFKESCALIYKILIALVQRIGQEDSEFAVQACNEALKRATDTGHYDYIANALYELGRTHLYYGNIKYSLEEFFKLLAMAKRNSDPERICNAHMELAFAYKEIDDTTNTEKHLNLFRDNAIQFDLPYKLAQAHYYIGEYLLNQMKPNSATPHLEKAFSLYYDLGSIEEADQARIITGISRGQEQIEQFINLILKCEKHNLYALCKMYKWKNKRDIFWANKQCDINNKENYDYYEHLAYPNQSILNHLTKQT